MVVGKQGSLDYEMLNNRREVLRNRRRIKRIMYKYCKHEASD